MGHRAEGPLAGRRPGDASLIRALAEGLIRDRVGGMIKFLHTRMRVSDLEGTIGFYRELGFELSEDAVVTLAVYDLTGQLVRTLISDRFMAAGSYESLWDGRNEAGLRVSSGVYLYRLNAGAFTAMKKMTLLQ